MSSATTDPRVLELLVRWEEKREAGRTLSAEELCADCPELLPAVAAELRRLGEMAAFESHTTGSNAAPAPAVALPPGYEMLGELGRGGMGVVYKARQVGLGRVVALKMILAGGHASHEQRMRFRIEAEAVANVRHPGIVEIYEFAEVDRLPYFSMEFCDGGSLAEELKRRPLTPRETATLVEALAQAVQHAHERGVVHRDLKPGNVLLERAVGARSVSDGSGEAPVANAPGSDLVPKITDFGLARRLDAADGPTRTGTPLGTLAYMAPEQAAGDTHHLGPAVDIHALGVILYEALTGGVPYRASSMGELVRLVCEAAPTPPRQLRPEVPADLEVICLKCLSKEPGKRYATARELADDLRRFLDGRPIQARRVGRGERAWMWARRRPVVAGLTAALLAAVVAGVGGVAAALAWALVGWDEAAYNEHAAREAAQRATDNANAAGLAEEKARKQLQAKLSLQYHTSINFAQEFLRRRLYRPATVALENIPTGQGHWELRYLERQLGIAPPIVRHLGEHDWGIVAGCLSPDGRRLATSGLDGRVLLWDVAEDRLVRPIQEGVWRPDAGRWRRAFNLPQDDPADGLRPDCFTGLCWHGDDLLGAASKARSGRAVRWTIRADGVSQHELLEHKAPLLCVAASPGGGAAFGAADGTLVGVSAAGQRQRSLALSGAAVLTLLPLPSGHWLAGQADGRLSLASPGLEKVVWDQEICKGPIWGLALAPDGKEVVVACDLPKLPAFRVDPGGKQLWREDSYLLPVVDSARAFAIHATHITAGGLVLARDDRARLLIWKRGDIQALYQLDDGDGDALAAPVRAGLPLYLRRKTALLVSTRDGQGLYTGGMDPVIRRWWLNIGQAPPSLDVAPRGRLLFVDGESPLLCAGDGEGRLHVWEPGEKPQTVQSIQAHEAAVKSLARSQTGLIASAGGDGLVRFWRRQGRKLEAAEPPLKTDAGLLCVSLDDKAERLCLYDNQDRVSLYELPSRRLLARRLLWEEITDSATIAGLIVGNRSANVFTPIAPAFWALFPSQRGLAVLSPDGSQVAVAGPGQTFLILSAPELTVEFNGSTDVLAGDGGVGLCWRRDAPGSLITGDTMGRLKQVTGRTSLPLPKPSGGEPLRGLTLTADGARAAALGNDGSVDLIDVEQRQSLLTLPPLHLAAGHDLAFSPCGRWLAVLHADGKIVCHEANVANVASPQEPPTIDPHWRPRRIYLKPEQSFEIDLDEKGLALDHAGRVWVLFQAGQPSPEAKQLRTRETFLGRETADGFQVEPLGLSSDAVNSMALVADGDGMVAAVRRKPEQQKVWTELLRRDARTGREAAPLRRLVDGFPNAGFSLSLFRHGEGWRGFHYCYGVRILRCSTLTSELSQTQLVAHHGDGQGLQARQGPDGRIHALYSCWRYDRDLHPVVYAELKAQADLPMQTREVLDAGCRDLSLLALTPKGVPVVLYQQRDSQGRDRLVLARREAAGWRRQDVPSDVLHPSWYLFSLHCPAEDEVLLTASHARTAYLVRARGNHWDREPIWHSPGKSDPAPYLLATRDGQPVILLHDRGAASLLHVVRKEGR